MSDGEILPDGIFHDPIAQRLDAAHEILLLGAAKPKDARLQSRINKLIGAVISSMEARSAEIRELNALGHESVKRELKRG